MSTCSLVLGSEHLQSRLQSMVSSFYLSYIITNIHLHLPTWKSAHMHTCKVNVCIVFESIRGSRNINYYFGNWAEFVCTYSVLMLL